MSFVQILPQLLTPQWSHGEATLRVFASSSFYEFSTGLYVGEGNPQDISSFCQEIACTLNGTELTLPAITLATTTDSSVPTSLYTATLYNAQNVPVYTMLSQFFVDPEYFQSPAQSSVTVEDAGSVAVNGNYTYRGQHNNLPYYNLEGQANSTTLYAIYFDGGEDKWKMSNGAGAVLYAAPVADFPWNEAWTADGGSNPAPNVNENQELVVATWEQLTISNQGSGTVYPFGLPGPFWNVPQIKQYVNSLVGDGTTPFANASIVGKTALTANPTVSTFPIAIGANDPVFEGISEAYFVNSYDSFADAITAIGVINAELIVTESTATTTITVPNNIRLTFYANGALDITGVVTIKNGLGMSADPSKQIFTGSGTVKFDDSYPSPFYYEWYGALGNGATDDLAAINACHTSMQRVGVGTTNYIGGIVQLGEGKFYACTDSINVRRPLAIIGQPAVAWVPACGFQFPANKTGIIMQASSTFDGISSTTQTSNGAVLAGFQIRGTVSANNTILSINGLTATLTGGTIQLVSSAGNSGGTAGTVVTPGSTITINNYNWIVANTLSQNVGTTSIPLEAPRVYVSANGTTTVTKGDFSTWPTDNDWVGSTITIGGTAYTINSMTTTTLVLNTTLATGLYTGTISGSASKTGVASRINIYAGLDARSYRCEYSDLFIRNFSGNGIECNSNRYPTAFPGTEPNNNLSTWRRVNVDTCAGSGLTLWGTNSNTHDNQGFDAQNCGGYGIIESQTSGSTYSAFHIAFNAKGPFKFAGDIAANAIFGGYTEGGQPSGVITGQFTLVLGGNYGAGFDTSVGYLPIITTSEGRMRALGVLNFTRDAGAYPAFTSTVGWIAEMGDINQQNVFFGWGMGSEPCNTASYTAAQAKIPAYLLSYGTLATGWYGITYGGNAANDGPSRTLIAMSGDAATEGSSKLWFPLGFYVGLSTAKRNWTYVTTKPVTGTAALGDIYWFKNTGAGDPVGWICTTAGDLSTTGVVTPFGATNLESITGTAGTLAQFAAGAQGGLKLANATETGTGSVVRANTPTLVTPVIGAATGTSLNVSGALVSTSLNAGSGAVSGGAISGTTLNLGGATVTDVLSNTAALNFDLSGVDYQDLTMTVTGAALGDTVMLGIPNGSVEAAMTWTAWVSAADTITIRALAVSGTPNPASGTFRATILKI